MSQRGPEEQLKKEPTGSRGVVDDEPTRRGAGQEMMDQRGQTKHQQRSQQEHQKHHKDHHSHTQEHHSHPQAI